MTLLQASATKATDGASSQEVVPVLFGFIPGGVGRWWVQQLDQLQIQIDKAAVRSTVQRVRRQEQDHGGFTLLPSRATPRTESKQGRLSKLEPQGFEWRESDYLRDERDGMERY